MTRLLILLAMPERARLEYFDRLRTAFPEVGVDVVDHHSKVGPYIGETDVLLTFGPMKRLHCHSQGYDMVERPLVRFDETMAIEQDMVVSCHPTYVTERSYSWACDNFLIGATGVVERLHKCPQQLFELG